MIQEIIFLVKEKPVTAGKEHPADSLVSLIVKKETHYIELFYLMIASYPNIRADLFKLLCRLDSKYLDNLTFHGICRRFLNDNNAEVVDAVIGMFESFSNKSILKDWLDSKPNQPQWLMDYASRIVNQDSSL